MRLIPHSHYTCVTIPVLLLRLILTQPAVLSLGQRTVPAQISCEQCEHQFTLLLRNIPVLLLRLILSQRATHAHPVITIFHGYSGQTAVVLLCRGL